MLNFLFECLVALLVSSIFSFGWLLINEMDRNILNFVCECLIVFRLLVVVYFVWQVVQYKKQHCAQK